MHAKLRITRGGLSSFLGPISVQVRPPVLLLVCSSPPQFFSYAFIPLNRFSIHSVIYESTDPLPPPLSSAL